MLQFNPKFHFIPQNLVKCSLKSKLIQEIITYKEQTLLVLKILQGTVTYHTHSAGEKGLGDHNYCRNPEGEYTQVWCYTTNPDRRWDWCDVFTCSELECCQSNGKLCANELGNSNDFICSMFSEI